MRLSSIFLFFFLPSLVFLLPAQAKLFKNSYVSFEIPEDWECKAFGTDWVCHSTFQEKKVEAIITSTAKMAGPMDTRAQYLEYLQQEKTWVNVRKEEITSKKITQARQVFINKFPWIDSIHKNSEVKSYISRYAGTVCCENTSSKVGILVILSAQQDHYTKYSAGFVKTVNSLRVQDIEKALPKIKASAAQGSGAGVENYLEGLFEEEPVGVEGEAGGLFGLPVEQVALPVAAALGGLGYYLIKRRKRRKPALRRRRKSSSSKKRK